MTSQEALLYASITCLKGRLVHEIFEKSLADRFLKLTQDTIANNVPYFIEYELNYGDIVGSSEVMQTVFENIKVVAETDATVLLLGETGTGKELIARAIHKTSSRKTSTLIKVNCGALPTSLAESELFGHEKGAFTGATEQKKGRFELAHHGTIFLDEVGGRRPSTGSSDQAVACVAGTGIRARRWYPDVEGRRPRHRRHQP